MRCFRGSLAHALVLVLGLGPSLFAYQFRTHNGITAAARTFLWQERARYGFDEDFARLLAPRDKHGFGDLIDSRAGDPYEDAWLDEDHEEGRLERMVFGCWYVEGSCTFAAALDRVLDGAPCTRDHFSDPLPAPLGGRDAVEHAMYYLDMAYRLYVAGKCARDAGLAEMYFRGAARALGHLLHLVEDMNVPQHVRPENHIPYPLGHGRSFYEDWAQDLWDRAVLYLLDGTPYVLGGFERRLQLPFAPVAGPLAGLMVDAAASSRALVARSPFARGSWLAVGDLATRFPGGFIEDAWYEHVDADGNEIRYRLGEVFWQYPRYARGYGLPHGDEHHLHFTREPGAGRAPSGGGVGGGPEGLGAGGRDGGEILSGEALRSRDSSGLTAGGAFGYRWSIGGER